MKKNLIIVSLLLAACTGTPTVPATTVTPLQAAEQALPTTYDAVFDYACITAVVPPTQEQSKWVILYWYYDQFDLDTTNYLPLTMEDSIAVDFLQEYADAIKKDYCFDYDEEESFYIECANNNSYFEIKKH